MEVLTDTGGAGNKRKRHCDFLYKYLTIISYQVELSFRTGDIITVFGDMDDDGFYMAELRGHRGLVPRLGNIKDYRSFVHLLGQKQNNSFQFSFVVLNRPNTNEFIIYVNIKQYFKFQFETITYYSY